MSITGDEEFFWHVLIASLAPDVSSTILAFSHPNSINI